MTQIADTSLKTPSRIQKRNRRLILDAALEVFSAHGFRGATLDQIAAQAGLSKPNILYYFASKEEIHVTLLGSLLDTWLDPLKQMNPKGDPLAEILAYVHRKLDLALTLPRESRLFAGEILQGAPRISTHLQTELKPLVERYAAIMSHWMEAGQIARCDPTHLIFSIWATTQHYADFAAQTEILAPDQPSREDTARLYLTQLFTALLTPRG